MLDNDPNSIDWEQAKKDTAEETKDLKKRVDPTGRLVPEKRANKPFFVHQDYKRKMQEAEDAKAERKRIRAEKIAKGEDPGPDPDAPSHVVGNTFRMIILMMLVGLYAGHFITGDPFWGYESRYLTARYWASFIPDGTQLAFAERQLLQYDGTDPEKPIYLAIDGIVYDVSEGRRMYGPGGSYHQFAGRDAARAYVTGCFKEHLTHDIRGFDEEQLKSLQHWKDFYAYHEKYKKIGTVYHPPIHPSTPIPEPCDPKVAKDSKAAPPVGPQLPPVAPEKGRSKTTKSEL